MLQCGPHLLDHIPESQYKESVCSMFHSTNSDDNEEGIDMKQFILSEDRVVLVKKLGEWSALRRCEAERIRCEICRIYAKQVMKSYIASVSKRNVMCI